MTRLVALLAVLTATAARAADPPVVAFVGVTVIDVAAGKPVPAQTVVVADRKIVAVGPAATTAVPDGATAVEGKGKFLIPGLWDMHTHIADGSYLSLFLANGVTGVREMHAFYPQSVLGMRDAVKSGKTLGPRIVAAGSLVDGPTPVWPGAIKTTTPDEGRAAVRKLKEMQADFVKVYSSLAPDVYRAVVAEAKAQGLPVAGHCPELVSVLEASDAGQRSVEHLMGVHLACSKDEAALRKELTAALEAKREKMDLRTVGRVSERAAESYDSDKAKAVYEKFVANRTWQCPTLVVIRQVGGLDPDADRDDAIRYMPPVVRGMWKQMFNPFAKESFKRGYKGRLKMVRAMHAAGVPLLAGTDCTNPNTYPGFSLPVELELLVDCGLTPAEALRTATVNPAKFFDEEKTSGSVEVGKRADLVLLDADPLAKVGNVRAVAGVMANGRYLPSEELKKMLADVASKFNK